MAKLPKIARDRLRQRNDRSPVDLRSAGGLNATRAASLGAGQHPDANLLAAFAERRLAGSERTLLLGHLADCAQCRELVALAFPSPEVQAAVADATRPRSGSSVWLRWPVWLPWGTVRWGVLAASVGFVLIGGFRAGVLRWPASHKSAPTISKSPADENKQPSVLRAANDSSSSLGGTSSLRRELAEVAQVPPAKRAQAHSNERDETRRTGQLPAAHESAAPDKAAPSIGFTAPSDAQQDRKVNRLPVQKSLGLQQVEVQADALAQKNTGRADFKAPQSAGENVIVGTPASSPPPPPAQPKPVQATQALRLLDGSL